MARNVAIQSMSSSGRGSGIAEHTRSSSAVDTADAIEQLQSLMARGKVPAHVKQVVQLLIETRTEMKELNRRNAELLEEIRCLREKNISLKEKIACFERSAERSSNVEIGTASKNVDHELDRSIVLSHVPESPSSKSSERLAHDFAFVVDLLAFLDVECTPVSVYRMGRVAQNKPRLVKVVLPSSKFQRLAVRRAPRLRSSTTQKGVYLRPSLTWEERMHRRELRQFSR